MCPGRYQQSQERKGFSQEFCWEARGHCGWEPDLESESFPSGLPLLFICPMTLKMLLNLVGLSFPSLKRRCWTNLQCHNYWGLLLSFSLMDPMWWPIFWSWWLLLRNTACFKIIQSHVNSSIQSFSHAWGNSVSMQMIPSYTDKGKWLF